MPTFCVTVEGGLSMNKRTALLMLQLGIVLVAAVVPALAWGPPTPEPASILLIGGGLGALILIGRWKRSRK